MMFKYALLMQNRAGYDEMEGKNWKLETPLACVTRDPSVSHELLMPRVQSYIFYESPSKMQFRKLWHMQNKAGCEAVEG